MPGSPSALLMMMAPSTMQLKSRAELDESETLDIGDWQDLAQRYQRLPGQRDQEVQHERLRHSA